MKKLLLPVLALGFAACVFAGDSKPADKPADKSCCNKSAEECKKSCGDKDKKACESCCEGEKKTEEKKK